MSIAGSEELRTAIEDYMILPDITVQPNIIDGKTWDEEQRENASEAECIRFEEYATHGITMYADFPQDTNGAGKDASRRIIHRDLGSDPNKFMVVDLRPVIVQAVDEAKGNYQHVSEWDLGYEATKKEIIRDTLDKLQKQKDIIAQEKKKLRKRSSPQTKRRKIEHDDLGESDDGLPGAQKTAVPTRPGREANYEEAESTAIGRTFLFLIRLLATVIP
jgi:hypothetical protein